MRMLKDNRGVSLTELIIAMSIIVVLSVTSLMSISVLTGAKVNRVCEDTVTLFERCKTLSLGKEQGQVEARVFIDTATNSIMAELYQGANLLDSENMGNTSVNVTVYFQGDSTGYALSSISGNSPARDTSGIHVMFSRGTGAFMEKTNKVSGIEKQYIEKIVFATGSRQKEIKLVGVTGKIMD